jgi:hypothetical protein
LDNNGVTILAEQASAQDESLTIRKPIVVNGLQTSHEIHRFFSAGKNDDARNRCVQVRVIEIEDDARRDRVIKATNSQTGIKPASLPATEPLQRKIEDYLLQQGIYYDRRKDFWRNKGKARQTFPARQAYLTRALERAEATWWFPAALCKPVMRNAAPAAVAPSRPAFGAAAPGIDMQTGVELTSDAVPQGFWNFRVYFAS